MKGFLRRMRLATPAGGVTPNGSVARNVISGAIDPSKKVDSPERVAERQAEASLQGFGNDGGAPFGNGALNDLKLGRFN